jgi:hypothetical protein
MFWLAVTLASAQRRFVMLGAAKPPVLLFQQEARTHEARLGRYQLKKLEPGDPDELLATFALKACNELGLGYAGFGMGLVYLIVTVVLGALVKALYFSMVYAQTLAFAYLSITTSLSAQAFLYGLGSTVLYRFDMTTATGYYQTTPFFPLPVRDSDFLLRYNSILALFLSLSLALALLRLLSHTNRISAHLFEVLVEMLFPIVVLAVGGIAFAVMSCLTAVQTEFFYAGDIVAAVAMGLGVVALAGLYCRYFLATPHITIDLLFTLLNGLIQGACRGRWGILALPVLVAHGLSHSYLCNRSRRHMKFIWAEAGMTIVNLLVIYFGGSGVAVLVLTLLQLAMSIAFKLVVLTNPRF